MDLLPVFSAEAVTVVVLAFYVYNLLKLASNVFSSIIFIPWVLAFVVGIPSLLLLRRHAREQQTMQASVANFSVQLAMCAVESDREVVFSNIVALMKFGGFVSHSASTQKALRAFNRLVQTNLGQVLMQSVGQHLVRYKDTLIIGILSDIPAYLDYLAGVSYGTPLREVIAEGTNHLTWAAALFPLWVRLNELLGSVRLDFPRSCDLFVAAVAWVFSIFVIVVVNVVYTWLEIAALESESDVGLILYVLSSALVVVVANLYMSGQLRLCRASRRMKPSPSFRDASVRATIVGAVWTNEVTEAELPDECIKEQRAKSVTEVFAVPSELGPFEEYHANRLAAVPSLMLVHLD